MGAEALVKAAGKPVLKEQAMLLAKILITIEILLHVVRLQEVLLLVLAMRLVAPLRLDRIEARVLIARPQATSAVGHAQVMAVVLVADTVQADHHHVVALAEDVHHSVVVQAVIVVDQSQTTLMSLDSSIVPQQW